MALYLITSKHEPQECLRALDEELQKGNLDKSVYGCKGGDHTSYSIVDVKSVSEALSLVPDFLQEKAYVNKVDKFTRGEIKSLHAKAV